ncbi:undecaprenyl-phosphate glucose phosphotransferase [Consotaella salsifontis]|uniref:Undecaprenyl-phosphate glucose phosphotransferase n=1 Tax=Consotaella salsifontis TaxID=1365950 RepID=A0A1T4RDP9_9HYPH|nr:undecaprenyl-phosphate glucose phosphotransferase [Consotaella salsifontis]SKA13868.1 Undecaprenyl-phosphate glucose phosphotransferase [Consotaella salsifontis]
MLDASDHSPFSPEAVRAARISRSGTVELSPAATEAAMQLRSRTINPMLVPGIWRGVEFASTFAMGLAGHAILFGTRAFGTQLLIAGLVAGIGVLFTGFLHGYQISVLRSGVRQIPRLALSLFGAFGLATGVAVVLGTASADSRWLAGWFAASLVFLAIARPLLSICLRFWARKGVMARRAVIVGGGQGAEALLHNLQLQPDSDIRICGIFDDRGDRRSPPIVAGYPKLGTVRELVEFARIARIDMLIVTLPLTAEKRVLSILKELWVLPLDIRLSAQASQIKLRPRAYTMIGDLPMLDVFDRPLTEWDGLSKRLMDLVLGMLALVLLSPLMVATAIAIKLDSSGPVFFRQKRHGFNNQIIEVLKFRSLYHEMADVDAKRIVTKGDPRVTRVGRFIRRTSIDELPQLFNVLGGSLSLVGPRPHAVHGRSSSNQAFVEIVDGYFGRHKVKPGITGWAQIKGWRGEIDDPKKLEKRFEHDLYYIEHWSILLDLYILIRTPFSLLSSANAY